MKAIRRDRLSPARTQQNGRAANVPQVPGAFGRRPLPKKVPVMRQSHCQKFLGWIGGRRRFVELIVNGTVSNSKLSVKCL